MIDPLKYVSKCMLCVLFALISLLISFRLLDFYHGMGVVQKMKGSILKIRDENVRDSDCHSCRKMIPFPGPGDSRPLI